MTTTMLSEMNNITLSNEFHKKLFAVIRSGLVDNHIMQSLSDQDYQYLLQIGEKQFIIPIIYQGLKNIGIPDKFIYSFNKVQFKCMRLFILQNDALQKVEETLENAKIQYVPLKGAVLRQLYPHPELRTCGDIDILVKEEDLEKAIISIKGNTDFKNEKRKFHDISMVNSDVHLELHFSILENMHNIDKMLSRVWDYVVPDVGFRYKFTTEFLIFHIIAHMSYHMVHGGLGIRHFIDLWLLRTKTVYNENEVKSMCRECNILIFYEKCCCLVDSWMTGLPIHNDLSIFENFVINCGVFGNNQTVLASRQREHRGLNYYYYRVFLSRSILEKVYPELKDRPYLIPIYQIKRWFRLFNPRKRKLIRNEIANVRLMNAETINSFDKLLQELGL